MKISFSKPGLPAKGALVVGVYEGKKLTASATELDRKTKGAIARAISGTAPESRSISSQSMMIPAARAMAVRWMTWLVDPPVASSATAALTIAFSSTQAPSGR